MHIPKSHQVKELERITLPQALFLQRLAQKQETKRVRTI